MSQQIAAHIAKQRVSIRRSQLQHIFANKRGLTSNMNIHQSKQFLMPHLESIKKFFIEENNLLILKQSLSKINHIIQKYNVLPTLMDQILLCSTHPFEINLKKSYGNEMTWIDLVLQILKIGHEDDQITQYCSSILSQCASLFKNKSVRKRYYQNQSTCQRICQRLVQNYPLRLIVESNIQTMKKSLYFVYEIVQSCHNGSIIYSLVNRNENIVKIINKLINRENNQHFQDLLTQANKTSVVLIYYISHYNLKKYVSEEYKILVNNTKKHIINRLRLSQSMQEFGQNCIQYTILLQSNSIQLSEDDFSFFQDMLERQIRNKNTPFFKMISILMKNYIWMLQPQSLKMILGELFYVDQKIEKELQLKKYLLIIYNNHIINNGNNFSEQDLQMFVGHWGQYSKIDKLLTLIRNIDSCCQGQQILKQIFYLMSKIGQGQDILNLMSEEHQDQIKQLFSYEQFRQYFYGDINQTSIL